MHVRIPFKRNEQWYVTVTKCRGPLSPVIETVPCGTSRNNAYWEYRRIQNEVKAMTDPTITIVADKVHRTGKAILLKTSSGKGWVPLKLVTDHGNGTFTLPESWAHDKLLVC